MVVGWLWGWWLGGCGDGGWVVVGMVVGWL